MKKAIKKVIVMPEKVILNTSSILARNSSVFKPSAGYTSGKLEYEIHYWDMMKFLCVTKKLKV